MQLLLNGIKLPKSELTLLKYCSVCIYLVDLTYYNLAYHISCTLHQSKSIVFLLLIIFLFSFVVFYLSRVSATFNECRLKQIIKHHNFDMLVFQSLITETFCLKQLIQMNVLHTR
jgi:hypothetical protein